MQVRGSFLWGLLDVLWGRSKQFKDGREWETDTLLGDTFGQLHTHGCARFDSPTDDRLGTLWTHQQQKHAANQVAEEIAGRLLILPTHAEGFLKGMLWHEVALLIIR